MSYLLPCSLVFETRALTEPMASYFCLGRLTFELHGPTYLCLPVTDVHHHTHSIYVGVGDLNSHACKASTLFTEPSSYPRMHLSHDFLEACWRHGLEKRITVDPFALSSVPLSHLLGVPYPGRFPDSCSAFIIHTRLTCQRLKEEGLRRVHQLHHLYEHEQLFNPLSLVSVSVKW